MVQVSSALSLGTLAALLYSIKAINPQIDFQPSAATLVAFALAAALLLFWHIVFQLNRRTGDGQSAPDRRRKVGLGLLAASLGIGLIVAFIYPLKDFSREKVSEIGFGAFIALGCLTLLGLLFWRVVRHLEGASETDR